MIKCGQSAESAVSVFTGVSGAWLRGAVCRNRNGPKRPFIKSDVLAVRPRVYWAVERPLGLKGRVWITMVLSLSLSVS